MPDVLAAPPSAATLAGAQHPAVHPLLILNLSGTQAEMGRQHGELLREQGGYEETLAYYPKMPESILGGPRTGLLGDRIQRAFLGSVVRMTLRRLMRDQPSELRGRALAFAEGLGVPQQQVQNMFVMDALQNVVNRAVALGLTGVPKQVTDRLVARAAVPACSSLAVWDASAAGGGFFHARNFDFPGVGVWEKQPTVVFCKPTAGLNYGFVTTRGADVAVTAFNEAGLTLVAHTCFHRRARFGGAGIVDLTHDIIRRAETLDQALAIARERPVSSTWTIAIGSSQERRAGGLEINAQGVELNLPRAGESFYAQSNHYRGKHRTGEAAPCAAFLDSSHGRLQSLRDHVAAGQRRGGMSAADLQEMLGSFDDPDVRGGERVAGGSLAQALSVKSAVIDPIGRAVHVSVGGCPTGLGPYVKVDWSWDAPVGQREVAVDPASAPVPRPGYAEFLEAAYLHNQAAEIGAVADAMERAVQAAPGEPTYRLLAGGFALHQGAYGRAQGHFGAGLERERAPFARGQLLLWGSRAADAAGAGPTAARWREELFGLDHSLLVGHQREAKREQARALPRRKLQKVQVNVTLPDLMLV